MKDNQMDPRLMAAVAVAIALLAAIGELWFQPRLHPRLSPEQQIDRQMDLRLTPVVPKGKP